MQEDFGRDLAFSDLLFSGSPDQAVREKAGLRHDRRQCCQRQRPKYARLTRPIVSDQEVDIGKDRLLPLSLFPACVLQFKLGTSETSQVFYIDRFNVQVAP